MADEGLFGGFPGGGWGAGATALGAGADLWSWFQNYQRQQAIRRIYDILANPAKLSAYVSRWYAPMTAAENVAVQRDLGANWAVMTGGAPGGSMNQFVADALAKIESQRYQTAASQALQALTGATGAAGAGPTSPMGNTSAILKALMTLRGQQQAPGMTAGLSDIPGWADYRAGERSVYPPPTTLAAGIE